MTTKPNKARLRALVKTAQAISPDRFDMSKWWCGTAGCLAGHYIRTNPRSGLRLIRSNVTGLLIPVSKGLRLFPALADHFGLSYDQTDRLFGADQYQGIPVRLSAVRRRVIALAKRYGVTVKSRKP